jgi:translation initiation factor 2 beta subunit (eIF-2beta)/eIF-5
MFVLLGIRTREHLLSTIVMVCEVCGVSAPQALGKQSTKFTLFFIPLFPVRRSTYHLECSHCGTLRPVDPRTAANLAA